MSAQNQAEISAHMRVSLDIQLKDKVNNINNVLTIGSIVEELSEDGLILIHMPMYQGYYYPLPRDESILMKFFIGAKLYALQVQFEGIIERGGFTFAKMRQNSKIALHQQRECYRLPCSLPVKISRIWLSEGAMSPETLSIAGRMVNFSDGGMLFSCNENIERGEKITLTFRIDKTEIVEAIVLRTEEVEETEETGEAEEEKFLFRTAVRFVNMDRTQKRRFYKYIVDKQIEERWR